MNSQVIERNNIHEMGNLTARETILFAHGYGSDQTAWRLITPAFEKDYHLVLYDLVGCGNSSVDAYDRSEYESLHDYADDLIEICDRLELRQVTLVAHSVSGMIGALASIKRPGLFKRMVFIGASPCYLVDGDYNGGFTREAVAGLLNAIGDNYNAWAWGFAPVAMNAPEQPMLGEEFALSLSSMRPDVSLGIATTIFLSDHRKDLDTVAGPVLIMQAHNDVAVPDQVGEYLHRVIPNSRLEWISTNGHFPHLSNPVEVIDAIKKFLAEM